MQNKDFGLHYDIIVLRVKQRLSLHLNFNLIQ